MSQWTHVCGCIRYDALRIHSAMEGNPARMLADEIPRGSEGPLRYQVWVNPETHQMAAYNVSLWGDLRDYDDVDAIEVYLERITRDQFVRAGVVTVTVEYQRTVTLLVTADGIKRYEEPYVREDG